MTRSTLSLCPVCYKEIPAFIEYGEHAIMHKMCSEHGAFSAMVERDGALAKYLVEQPAEGTQPDLFFVEVTRRCNMQCKYCYSCKSGYHPSIEYLKQQFKVLSLHGLSFALSGGEPTVRDDILELAAYLKGRHILVTNCLKLGDESFLDAYLEAAGVYRIEDCPNPITTIAPSINIKSLCTEDQWGKKMAFLNHLADRGLMVDTAFFTIEKSGDVDEVIETAKAYRHVIRSTRIRCAAGIGGEGTELFASDVLARLDTLGKLTLHPSRMAFADTRLDDLDVKVICWYNVHNIDLLDMHQAPPLYLTRNGMALTVNHAIVVNEGIDKGWLNGQQIQFNDKQKPPKAANSMSRQLQQGAVWEV